MPGKMARSGARLPLGLPGALVAVRTSRLSCDKAEKEQKFTPVREPSGESRSASPRRGRRHERGARCQLWMNST